MTGQNEKPEVKPAEDETGKEMQNVQSKQPKQERSKRREHAKQKVQKLQNEVKELTELLQRLQAEFENYKKRVEAEKLGFIRYSKAELILKLLPIIDSFEFALRNTNKHADFVKGVELVYSQLYEVMEKEGLKRIESLRKKLDPEKHEVMMVVEADTEPDTIIEELQPGYLLHDRVIRHAKVKISKKKVLRN